jgi:hypothetical protein
MIAGELQQPRRIELVSSQAGDGVDHFRGAAILQLADALDATDGCDAWPILIEAKGQLGAHPDAPRLDSSLCYAVN